MSNLPPQDLQTGREIQHSKQALSHQEESGRYHGYLEEDDRLHRKRKDCFQQGDRFSGESELGPKDQ